MPQKKSPNLKRICLDAVADNIERFSCGSSMLFKCLPVDIMEELIRVLRKEKYEPLAEKNLEFLILPGLRRINFRDKMWTNTRFIVALLIPTGKYLTHLTLGFCKWLSTPDLVKLVGHLPNITYLDLSETQCFKEVLLEIAEKCPKIVSLILSKTSINDACLHALCFNDPDDWQQPRNLPLVHLDIRNTLVTALGAATALKYLKHLKCFFISIDSSIFVLYQECFSVTSTEDATLKLQTFQHPWPIRERNLVTVIDLCPNLKKISIDVCDLKNDTLQVLSKSKNLEHLVLKYVTGKGNVTFEGGIEPLLQNVGKNLNHLEIQGIQDVDISVIGFYCPKLKFLKIRPGLELKFARFNRTKLHVPFKELIQASIEFGDSDHVRYILQNAKHVREVELLYCSSFTDDDFIRLLALNPLKFLNSFKCVRCNGLTARAILTLLKKENPLHTLIFAHCHDITAIAKVVINYYTAKENLDVRFVWELP